MGYENPYYGPVSGGGIALELESQPNRVSGVERGSLVTFGISLVDRDTGNVPSANIDIAGISVSLQKSTGGGAFSASGITQPTFTKADGKVTADYLFAAGEWLAGDGWKLTVSGIFAQVGSPATNAYVPIAIWSGLVLDHSDVIEDVNDIRSTLGEKTDAALGTGTADDGTQSEVSLTRGLVDRVGNLNDAASTGAPGTTTTLVGFEKQIVNDVQDVLDGVNDAKRLLVNGSIDSWTSSSVFADTARTEANDYWIGYGVRFLDGFNVGIIRRVTDFVSSTGTFTVSPAFETQGLPGALYELIPPLTLTLYQIGGIGQSTSEKADTSSSDVQADRVGTLFERLEDLAVDVDTLIAQGVPGVVTGIADAGSTSSVLRDSALTQADDAWNGALLVFTTGSNAKQARLVVDFVAATDDATVEPAFINAIAAGDQYVLVPSGRIAEHLIGANNGNNHADTSAVVGNRDGSLVERLEEVADDTDTLIAGNAVPAVDSTANALVRDVAGNKTDAAASGNPGTTKSLVALLKQAINDLEGTAGVVTYPAAAAPGNGVNLAAVLRRLFDDIVLLAADVGDASGSVKGSIYGILGNPATDTLVAVLGQKADAQLATGGTADGTHSNISLLRTLVERLGHLATASNVGDPTTTATFISYLKQIVDVLVGTAGIATWPAAAVPGNGVSLTEVIRKIHDQLSCSEAVISYTYTNVGLEQTVYESTLTTRRHVLVDVSNRLMAQAGTFKLYRKVDGTTYDQWDSTEVLASGNRCFDYDFWTNQHWKLTYTESADEGSNKVISGNVIEELRE